MWIITKVFQNIKCIQFHTKKTALATMGVGGSVAGLARHVGDVLKATVVNQSAGHAHGILSKSNPPEIERNGESNTLSF